MWEGRCAGACTFTYTCTPRPACTAQNSRFPPRPRFLVTAKVFEQQNEAVRPC